MRDEALRQAGVVRLFRRERALYYLPMYPPVNTSLVIDRRIERNWLLNDTKQINNLVHVDVAGSRYLFWKRIKAIFLGELCCYPAYFT